MIKGIPELQNLLVKFEDKGVVVVTAGLAIVEILRTTSFCIVRTRIGCRSHSNTFYGGMIFQRVGPHRKAQQQVVIVNMIAEVMSMKARNKKKMVDQGGKIAAEADEDVFCENFGCSRRTMG